MKLSNRKAYAKKMLKKRGKDPLFNCSTRGYENCFEGGDGDKVVVYLVEQSKTDPILRDGMRYSGSLDYWEYFAKNGTYSGFKDIHSLD